MVCISSLLLPQLQEHARQLQQSPHCAAAASPNSHLLQTRTQPLHSHPTQPLDCSRLLQSKKPLLSRPTFDAAHCQRAEFMLL
jgi:hypothetical protein